MTLFEHENECVCPYKVCVVLTVIVLTISIGIGAYFAYKYINHRYLKGDANRVKLDTQIQTTIYWIYKWDNAYKKTLKIKHITFFVDPE